MPYPEDLPWHLRHCRRLQAALAVETMVRNWCEVHGMTLTVKEGGWLWEFAKGNKLAQWRPSSATLYLIQPSRRNVHCHDYCQVQAVLRERWKLKDVAWMEGKR